jgi:hypothetical protein
MAAKKKTNGKTVETLKHDEVKRKNTRPPASRHLT